MKVNYEVINGSTGVHAKAWVKGVQLEQEARDQIANLAQMSFVTPHIAVMPDAHAGKGSTVGTVIATRRAIIPAAVGVDIGCLDRDTEYLTPNGWKNISEYDGGNVLQYDAETDIANFVQPISYIKKRSKGFYHFKNKYGLDQKLSYNHKMLFWHGTKGRGFKPKDYVVEEYVNKHNSLKKGFSGGIKTTFKIDNIGINLSDELIRIHAMVSADGCIRDNDRIELHFKKERKIDRGQKLLNLANIHYNITICKDGSTFIYFKLAGVHKNLSQFWSASNAQLNILADECIFWDGHVGKHEYYSSKEKENADIIQYAFSVSGVRANISKIDYINENWNSTFSVYKTKNEFIGIGKTSTIEYNESEDGYEYCFTVPSGYIVVRRNNKIFITGNCGVIATKTSLKANDLPDNLSELRHLIEAAVPHGRTNNGGSGDRGAWYNIPADLFYRAIGDKHSELLNNATFTQTHLKLTTPVGRCFNQLGTLGSGNHFIEICLDTEDYVWIMIHSGSRGVGNAIGSYFIEKAKEEMAKWFVHLPDQDLAYLPEGSQYFNDYVYAVKWAQQYALLNREIMMKASLEALYKFTGISFITLDKAINCHHNYISWERHYGDNLMITRKGAVSAQKDELGIILGSMGVKSYIVKGKGNRESFCSCSHGAGRTMSRTKAKATFTVEDHIKATHGVECLKDESVLDETPGAYKDIDAVMMAQTDLVDIVATLKQIVCVKG